MTSLPGWSFFVKWDPKIRGFSIGQQLETAGPVLFQLFDVWSIHLWWCYRYFQGIPMTLEVTNQGKQGHWDFWWGLVTLDVEPLKESTSHQCNQGCGYGFLSGDWDMPWYSSGSEITPMYWTQSECDDERSCCHLPSTPVLIPELPKPPEQAISGIVWNVNPIPMNTCILYV